MTIFPKTNAVLYTIGHSNRSIEEFTYLLQKMKVGVLVDVRRFPQSARYPHFNSAFLSWKLKKSNIAYIHMPDLGGKRPPRGVGHVSEHTLWRAGGGFQNYADYAETAAFKAGLNKLLQLARAQTVTIMCAEALWQDCHRRIITDYLLIAGVEVKHMMKGKIEIAKLTDGALIRSDNTILYSAVPLFAQQFAETGDPHGRY